MATARTRVAAARNCAVSDPEGPPKALQASECDELLDHTRASYMMILAQRQPGKLNTLSAMASSMMLLANLRIYSVRTGCADASKSVKLAQH